MTKINIKKIFIYLILSLITLLFISPIWIMIVGSLKPDIRVLTEAGSWQALFTTQVNLQNYDDVFNRVPFGRYMLNSVIINGLIVGLGLLVNSFAAYALARLQWPGRKFVFALVLAVLVIPFEAIAIPLFFLLSALGWRDSYLVQVIPFVASPLAIYLFYSFFLSLPKELEEAARVDGASILRIFFAIVLPNSKPVFASVSIVTFLFYWGLYLWPLLMTTSEEVRPLPLGIANFFTLPPLQWGDIFAFGVMMVLPVLIIFMLQQRWFVRGVVATGIKS